MEDRSNLMKHNLFKSMITVLYANQILVIISFTIYYNQAYNIFSKVQPEIH